MTAQTLEPGVFSFLLGQVSPLLFAHYLLVLQGFSADGNSDFLYIH